MPMHFGYLAHRHYGLGFRRSRSGRQMQQDAGYAARFERYKREAYLNCELARLIYDYQDRGWTIPKIVEALDRDADGRVVETRRRRAALVGAKG